MDSITNTADIMCPDLLNLQKNTLLEIIKELCTEDMLSSKLKGKVIRIIADCDLTHHNSLHKLSAANDSISTLLGVMHQTASELTFDEQSELNQSIIQKIQTKIPTFTAELENLKHISSTKKSHKEKVKELQESIDDKLNTIEEQENEKVELMMQWLNHRTMEVTGFSDNSSELLTLKTRFLELKSEILHLQILLNIFTETNQSIKAYSKIHKDLKDSIKEAEQRIKIFKDIIESDLN